MKNFVQSSQVNIENLEFLDHLLKEEKEKKEYKKWINNLTNKDLLELFKQVSIEQMEKSLLFLENNKKAYILSHLDAEQLKEIFRKKTINEVLEIFYNIDSETGLFILKSISANYRKVEALKARKKLEDLETEKIDYPEETIGKIMKKNNHLNIYSFEYIYEVLIQIYILQKIAKIQEEKYFCVLNEENKFLGVVSFKELLITSPESLIKDILNEDILKLNPLNEIDETLVSKFENSSYNFFPIVTERNKILGILEVKDLLFYFFLENQEDLQKEAGILDIKSFFENIPFLRSVFSRLPSLCIGILGGSLTASIISFFHDLFLENAFLYFFLPSIMALSGIIGGQTMAMIIHGLIRYQYQKFNFKNLIIEEIQIGTVNSLICGLSLFTFSMIWNPIFPSLFIMGASIISSSISVLLAISIVMFLDYIKIDPKTNSGPFFVVLSDFNTILIYLFLGSIIINQIF